jgi:phage terminase small subunit
VNSRQERFVAAYVGNATEAAIKAGYSPRSAYNQGRRMMNNDEVKAAIEAREKQRTSKIIASREERQSFWTTTMRNKKAKMADRLKASEYLGRSEGDFLDRTEITGEKGGPIVFRWNEQQES